jgi:hypothetical protein
MGSLAIKLVILMGILSSIGGGIMYIKLLQARIDLAVENQAKLQNVVDQQKQVMDLQNADNNKMRELADQLNKNFQQTQAEKSALQKKFNQTANGNTRDFGNIALQKPGLVEPIINTATQYSLRCNEIVSGAVVKAEDKSNNICPDIIKLRMP